MCDFGRCLWTWWLQVWAAASVPWRGRRGPGASHQWRCLPFSSRNRLEPTPTASTRSFLNASSAFCFCSFFFGNLIPTWRRGAYAGISCNICVNSKCDVIFFLCAKCFVCFSFSFCTVCRRVLMHLSDLDIIFVSFPFVLISLADNLATFYRIFRSLDGELSNVHLSSFNKHFNMFSYIWTYFTQLCQNK